MSALFASAKAAYARYGHWWRAFRLFVLPILIFLAVFFFSGVIIAFSVPSPNGCEGAWLLCNSDFHVEGWLLGFAFYPVYNLCILLMTTPTRGSLLMSIGIAIGFGSLRYSLAGLITADGVNAITTQSFLLLPVEAVVTAIFALAVGSPSRQRRWLWIVGALLLLLTHMLLTAGPRIEWIFVVSMALIWPTLAAAREWLGGRWTKAHSLIGIAALLLTFAIWWSLAMRG